LQEAFKKRHLLPGNTTSTMTYGRACNHQPVTHITEFKQGLQSVPASGSFFPQKALQVVFYFRSLFHHTITGNDFLHADSEKNQVE